VLNRRELLVITVLEPTAADRIAANGANRVALWQALDPTIWRGTRGNR
jgi:hypothetical protein